MKYRVYAAVTGGKYIGEFEADTKEEAIDKAQDSDAAQVSLCHHCSSECESPETHKFIAEEV